MEIFIEGRIFLSFSCVRTCIQIMRPLFPLRTFGFAGLWRAPAVFPLRQINTLDAYPLLGVALRRWVLIHDAQFYLWWRNGYMRYKDETEVRSGWNMTEVSWKPTGSLPSPGMGQGPWRSNNLQSQAAESEATMGWVGLPGRGQEERGMMTYTDSDHSEICVWLQAQLPDLMVCSRRTLGSCWAVATCDFSVTASTLPGNLSPSRNWTHTIITYWHAARIKERFLYCLEDCYLHLKMCHSLLFLIKKILYRLHKTLPSTDQ